MAVEQTPPLSPEGSQEVRQEMESAPEDSPERRETFRRIRELEKAGKVLPKPDGTVRRR